MNKYIFTILGFTLMLSLCSCQETRKNIYINIDNPRKLGEVTNYTVINGKIMGFSSSPGPDTKAIHEYLCAMAIVGKMVDGIIEPVYYYDVNRGGFFGSIQYERSNQKEESATTPVSGAVIGAPNHFHEFIFVFHSLREETGLRVFRATREVVMKSDELHPIQVPDLLTLPTINEVPESARLLELYGELKKYEEFKPK
jgi:hypothetical protein